MSALSYRLSHQAPGHGRQYEATLFSPCAYDAKVWKLERRWLARLIDGVFPRGMTHALDFACGTGRITAELHGRAWRVTGVDVSAEMLAVAEERLPAVHFVRGDLTVEPGLVTGSFDCITCFRFFLNAEPVLRLQALEALVPLLATDGVFVCNNHGNRTSLLAPVLAVRRLLALPVQRSLPRRKLETLLKASGLTIERRAGVCFLPRFLAQRLPERLFLAIETLLSWIPFLSGFAVYQIYLCRRRSASS